MNIKQYLKEKGIKFREFKHNAVYTCEQAEKERIYDNIRGIHSKNLFLKERKGRRFYLLVMRTDKNLDINKINEILGDKLKFANEQDLKEILGLDPGSVSPFGLINDKEHKVEVVIDKEVWDSGFVSFHPNINTETLELSKQGFHKYIKSLDNKKQVLKL